MANQIKIGVIGLGYVGLPLALAFAEKFPGTIGFDISTDKIAKLKRGIDPTGEGLEAKLQSAKLKVTEKGADLAGCNFLVVGVPTPVDINRMPDLEPLRAACETLGSIISGGETIVFESTVYPGVTEDYCGAEIARHSGLKPGKDFFLAYSPERINPGDKEHTLERIKKVVSGDSAETLERVAEVYGKVISAGIHRAPSIKVAEAAKVIENTQRDLNIALMNELAIIFDRMEISTKDVLDAAATKWNFLRFAPGLVGGHCIGVDPYYLTTKAEQLGYHPEVILAGRRINDGMGSFIAQKTVKLMVTNNIQPKGAKVGVLGLTFKENIHDIRNSRVPDIIRELQAFGSTTLVYDPYADKAHAHEEYGVTLCDWKDLKDLDAIVLAVSHREFVELGLAKLCGLIKNAGVFVDVKSVFSAERAREEIVYWSL